MRKPLIFRLRYWCVMLLLLLLCFSADAQNKDSLLQLVPSAKPGKDRIHIMYLIMGDSGDNDPVKALYYYKKLLALSHKMNDKVAEAVVTAEMGYALYMMGNTAAGSELLFSATHLADEIGDQQAIGIAYDNLICVYPDPVKQKPILHKALAASTAAKDYYFMCWELTNLSGCFGGKTEVDSALYYCQQLMALATAQNVEETKAYALVAMGWINYRMGQKKIALDYFTLAKADPYLLKDAKAAGSVLGSLATYYLYDKIKDSGLYYARLHYDVVKNAFYSIQIPAAMQLTYAYRSMNNIDSAFKYMSIVYTMKDSLQSRGKLQQIQSQIMLEEERQQKTAEERNQNIQYAALALGLAALFIGFLLLSHSIIANQKIIRFLGVVSLLIVFEFLNLLLHPWLSAVTHHSPALMLLIMVCMAALLVPMHHKLEHWITHKLVAKNNKIRLAAAHRTIQQLEGSDNAITN